MRIMSRFDDPHFETRDRDRLDFGDPGAEPAKARGEYFPSALSIFASADRPCNDVLRPGRGFSTSLARLRRAAIEGGYHHG
ncbi:hypothetical protein [Rhizobium laguerreae]|uniref:hypothetical protein n=1 Tax=Rhizobium laguerreae TaxID=1076926 RepID=UPI00197DB618|nr:hypothetical protein [Rhizobium laguerreae]